MDPAGAPKSNRDAPLVAEDPGVLAAIEALDDQIDKKAVRSAWQESSCVSRWNGNAVWIHGDLLPTNL